MYQLAKSAQAMAQQAEREEKESKWDEDEEAAFRDKMDELNQNVSDALAEIPDKMTDLSTAQIENIVVTE
jgi:chemotaxis protein CheY-P-specific phosphatase CheC